jgi:hypothetical protein
MGHHFQILVACQVSNLSAMDRTVILLPDCSRDILIGVIFGFVECHILSY